MKHYFYLFLLTFSLLSLGNTAAAESRTDLWNLVNSIRLANVQFYAGVAPGFYDVAKVQAYEQALSDATYTLEHGSATADYTVLYSALNTAYADVRDNGLISITDGYYFFISAMPTFEQHQSVRKALYDAGSGTFKWKTFSPSDLQQIWRVTSTGSGNFSIQNAGTSYYIGGEAGANGTGVPMTASHEVNQKFRSVGLQQFNIYNANNDIPYCAGDHGDGWHDDRAVVVWEGGAGTYSAWYIVPVSDLQVSHLQNSDATTDYNNLVNAFYSCVHHHRFLGGSTVGYHGLSAVVNYNAALQAAQAGLASTEADYSTLASTLTAATSEAEASLIMPESGRYYAFINAYPNFEQHQDGKRKAINVDGEGNLGWSTWTKDVTVNNQIWQVIKSNDKYYVQNYSTGKYFGGASGQSAGVPMTDDMSVAQNFLHKEGFNQFIITSETCGVPLRPNCWWEGENVNGVWQDARWESCNITTDWWSDGNSPGCWIIVDVTDEIAAYATLETNLSGKVSQSYGTTPGYYNDADKVAAYNSALSAANTAYSAHSMDYDYALINATLTAAYDDLSSSYVGVTNGCYYFVNAMTTFESAHGNRVALYDADGTFKWKTLTPSDQRQVWQVTSTGDGTFSIQSVGTGRYMGSVAGDAVNGTAVPLDASAQNQKFRFLGSGLFNIYYGGNEIPYCTGNHDNGNNEEGPVVLWEGGSGTYSAWYIIPADDASFKITDAEYATFIAPFDVVIPDGVTASTATLNANGVTLDLTPCDGVIPAHTPVVLYSTSTCDKQVYGLASDPDDLTEGVLTGTYADIPAPNGSYILQKHGGVVAFYQVDTSVATPYVRANRAYLTAPTSTVKAFYFNLDDADAIRSIDNGQLTIDNAEIYNLAGQKMSMLQKGVYIVNGKKVLVK